MSFYDQEELPFVNKIKGVHDDALYNGKVITLRFLNIREIYLLNSICHDLYVYLYPGDFELKRAVVSSFEIEPDYKTVLYELVYDKKHLELNHRKLLGNLLGLGISKDSVGDILFTTNGRCYFFVTEEISKFVESELHLIEHNLVSLYKRESIEGEVMHNYDTKQYFVSSLRLDLVIATGYNLSREEVKDIIMSGNVKVNQRPTKNVSETLELDDVISVKGYGRIKLTEIGGLSKSNKIYIKLSKLL